MHVCNTFVAWLYTCAANKPTCARTRAHSHTHQATLVALRGAELQAADALRRLHAAEERRAAAEAQSARQEEQMRSLGSLKGAAEEVVRAGETFERKLQAAVEAREAAVEAREAAEARVASLTRRVSVLEEAQGQGQVRGQLEAARLRQAEEALAGVHAAQLQTATALEVALQGKALLEEQLRTMMQVRAAADHGLASAAGEMQQLLQRRRQALQHAT